MKFGVTIFPTDYSIPLSELAVAAEERDLESLWVAEHSHIPVSRESPWPGGSELPKMYYDTLDPFVTLAAAAAVTERIQLATGICLVVQRDPIHTAKQVASLDQISKGRFLFGVGGGWNAEEMVDHGTAFEGRFKLMRERIEAMKVIWSQSKAEYHGERVDFDPLYMWPKPVQKPHPRFTSAACSRALPSARCATENGWIPIGGRGDDLDRSIPEFRRLAEEAGRDPRSLEVSVYGVLAQEKAVAAYLDLDIDRIVFGLPPAPRDEILPILDACNELARKFS